jgi:hypothetical protein
MVSALHYNLGYHVSDLSAFDKVKILKVSKGNACMTKVTLDDQHLNQILFALQRANQPSMACVKSSILIFYMSIFTTNKFRIAAWVNIVYTLLWAIIGWIVNLLVCHPVNYFYDKTIEGGTCGNQDLSGSLNGAFGALGDVAILSLPIFMISRLHLNPRKKGAVSLIFLLGGL